MSAEFTAPPPDSVWRAPLVPVALAFTAGVVLDHQVSVPLVGCLFAAALALLAWAATHAGGAAGLPLVYLAVTAAAVGAAYHHLRRDVIAEDDIRRLAGDTPRPVHLRGVV